MRIHLIAGLGAILMGVVGGAFVFSQDTPERLTITLERAVHFLAHDGAETVLAPGVYTAKAHDEKSIQVIAVSSGETTTIQAAVGTHEQQLSAPQLVAVASDEDVVHIVVLMPGGTTLDAIGTLSGVRTRGPMMAPLQSQQLTGVMAMQPALGTPLPIPVPGGGPAPGIPQVGGQLPEKFQTQPLQPGQVPQLPQKGPQLSGGCLGPDGKLLPPDRLVDIHLVAKATGPFSVQLSWSGPAADYQVSGPGLTTVTVSATGSAGTATLANPGSQNLPSRQSSPGVGSSPSQPSVVSGGFIYQRPQYPVLPDFDYSYVVKTPLPDGRLACGETKVKTLPALIAPLPSTFVGPTDVRLGFVLPPYVQELIVKRRNYTEDGRQPPSDKTVLQEPQQNPPGVPVAFGLGRGDIKGQFYDGRKRINPGLPPLPYDYNRPLVYDFIVEAVWRDGAGRSSTTKIPIRVDGPLPLLGWADLHTHPMSHLAFGGKLFHGAPDAGSLLPALSIPPAFGDPRNGCLVLRGLPLAPIRSANINEALADDSPTHGDPAQSVCGDAIRKTLITAVELAAHADMPQPGRRLGAPVFDAWPRWNDVTHQKMWVEWIRRAYQGGLRVMVGLSHNNRLLGELARGRCDDPARPCVAPTDDVNSSDLQIMEMKNFVLRHSDFMEVALNSADLSRIVRGDPAQNVQPKIAVVLGIEIDNIGNFKLQSPPTADQIRKELSRLYIQGVRYIFPVHVTDNVFGGTAPYNVAFDAANVFETGHFWDVECAGTQPYPDDQIGFRTPNVTILDELNRAIPAPFNSVIPKNVELPKSPQNCPGPGHRNKKGLNLSKFAGSNSGPGIGEFAIKEMMRLGMIIDVDHMSHRTVEDVLSIAEGIPGGGYPLMSGHSGIRDLSHFNAENSRTRAQLDRIGCLGGMFGLGTDHAEPRIWAAAYQDSLNVIRVRGPRCLYKEIGAGAVAFGTDANSLVQAPKSLLDGSDLADRQLNVYTSVVGTSTRFPFSGAPKIGTQAWDFRTDGVAHYGMLADFVKAVWSFPFDHNRKMHISGQDLVDNHLSRNADNFWRMWVKAEAQKSNVH